MLACVTGYPPIRGKLLLFVAGAERCLPRLPCRHHAGAPNKFRLGQFRRSLEQAVREERLRGCHQHAGYDDATAAK